jgi:hypothetical protein
MAAVVGMVDRAVTQCIRYSDGYRYQLRAPYAVLLPEMRGAVEFPVSTDWLEFDSDGWLRIRAGYAWDGASGPTWDTKSSMRASLAHDSLYQLCRLGHISQEWRQVIDRIFHRMCVEDGMFSPRAWLWYHAVRIFASPAADPAAESPDERAGCGCP